MEKKLTDHALLIGVLGKYCQQNCSDPEMVLKKITCLYGKQRGKRMAQLCKENDEDLDLNGFMVHGEWKAQAGENVSEMLYEPKQTRSIVSVCGWYDTWKKYDLVKYGNYYCQYIDQAIAEGFGGDFTLEVSKTLGHGADHCEFCFDKGVDAAYIREMKKDERWIRDFTFHFNELSECIAAVLGNDALNEVLALYEDLRENN